MTQYIHGVFGGALVICLFMLNFSEPKSCYVSVGHGNEKHISVGYYSE